MVNFSQGGMNIHSAGRGIAHRAGAAQPKVAGHPGAAPSDAGTAAAEARAPLAEMPPTLSAQPAKDAGRTTSSAARLLSALLRILTAAGTAHGAEASPRPGAGLPAGSPQSGVGPSTQPHVPAGPQLISTLLRILTGTLPHPAASSPPPTGTSNEQPAGTAQPTPQPRPPQEMSQAGPRTDLPAPPAATGLPANAAPQPAPAAPEEHPSPRAELVPPGNGVQGRNGADLPIVPAALVALALPMLAAVLASLF